MKSTWFVAFLMFASTFCAEAQPLGVLLGAQVTQNLHQSFSLDSSRKGAIIRQTTDATCGPAALASLLKFYFNDPTASEAELTELSGTLEKRTTTLLGLRNACRAKGYEAKGFSMTLPQLLQQVETSGVPVLVHYKEPSLHYALVCGRVENFLLISDPSQGQVSVDVTDFLRRWDGYALVVSSSQPANKDLMKERKASAQTRLETLSRAGALMSGVRF